MKKGRTKVRKNRRQRYRKDGTSPERERVANWQRILKAADNGSVPAMRMVRDRLEGAPSRPKPVNRQQREFEKARLSCFDKDSPWWDDELGNLLAYGARTPEEYEAMTSSAIFEKKEVGE